LQTKSVRLSISASDNLLR